MDEVATKEPDLLASKELAIVIPIIGTAIAISYDVGYFHGIDIQLFTLFSVAEHILFALEAAPLAFGLAVGLIAFIGPGLDLIVGLKINAVGQNLEKTPRLVVTIGLLAIGIVGVGAAFYFRRFGFIAGLLSGVATALFRILTIPRKVIYLASGVLVMATAFAMGHDNARSFVFDGPAKHSIQLEHEVLAVKLIRSGDRGVLYYEPKSSQLNFLRWEDIKKLTSEW